MNIKSSDAVACFLPRRAKDLSASFLLLNKEKYWIADLLSFSEEASRSTEFYHSIY